MAADLLRAPPTTKQLGDQTAEAIVGVDPAAMRTCSPRSRSTEPVGDRAQAQPAAAQIGDLDALVLGHVARADLTDRQAIQGGTNPTSTPLR
ncbi:MAG TPA: hypothetical protein VJT72_21980 [Pseudonocardiaceae bacterium]|nr:hypothetical protein [Pseudonocardiaceae bacterium]